MLSNKAAKKGSIRDVRFGLWDEDTKILGAGGGLAHMPPRAPQGGWVGAGGVVIWQRRQDQGTSRKLFAKCNW